MRQDEKPTRDQVRMHAAMRSDEPLQEWESQYRQGD